MVMVTAFFTGTPYDDKVAIIRSGQFLLSSLTASHPVAAALGAVAMHFAPVPTNIGNYNTCNKLNALRPEGI